MLLGDTLFIGFGINHPAGGFGMSDFDETPVQPQAKHMGGNGNVGNGNNIGGNGNATNRASHSTGTGNGINGVNGLKVPTVIGVGLFIVSCSFYHRIFCFLQYHLIII